jgi:hypothetical protein
MVFQSIQLRHRRALEGGTGPSGEARLDRTTLAPEHDGSVRQKIEVSSDGGNTWRTTFDASYVR